MAFPGSIPSYTGFTPGHTLLADAHASQHNLEQADIAALATKIGTGASTPTSGMVLRGNGVGASAWAQVVMTTDVTGVLPQANGGTGTTLATGTGKAVYDTSPALTTPTIASFINSTHTHQNAAGGGTLTGAALQTNTVAYNNLALGVLVQTVSSVASAVATGTTVIPFDDTIPQSTEGDQYMTASITPKSTTNTLVVLVTAVCASSAANHLLAALFQDSGADALAATGVYQATNAGIVTIALIHSVVAGTTSATTFKVRLGQESPGTLTFNGRAAARIFGAITKSSITIMEYNS